MIASKNIIMIIKGAASILSAKVASQEYIDKTMKLGANHQIGRLALEDLIDLIGLDVCLSIMTSLFEETGDTKCRSNINVKQYVRAGFISAYNRSPKCI